MAKSKKVNPRSRPATADDVRKAYELGKRETIDFVIAIAALSVHDVFSPNQAQFEQFQQKYNANVQAVLANQIKLEDVMDTLKAEYDCEIVYTE